MLITWSLWCEDCIYRNSGKCINENQNGWYFNLPTQFCTVTCIISLSIRLISSFVNYVAKSLGMRLMHHSKLLDGYFQFLFILAYIKTTNHIFSLQAVLYKQPPFLEKWYLVLTDLKLDSHACPHIPRSTLNDGACMVTVWKPKLKVAIQQFVVVH